MRFFLTSCGPAVVLCAIAAGSVAAQPVFVPPPHRSDVVFADDALATVRVTLAAADLARILSPANQSSDVEVLARFEFESPGLTESVDSVGFRLRGNTSRASQKKSFRVSFNSFVAGRKFRGLEKLNLNGEHNDPSIMRAKLAWDLFRDAGVPASRANHVALWINGEYYGLMANVEQVDEQFLDRWFGNDSGHLYKCLWPADLTYKGSTGASYRPTGANRTPYDLQLGVPDSEGYDDLAQLISVINRTSDAVFRSRIEQELDVIGLLRAMAVIVATGSWDSYWFLKNNFYLYNEPVSGRFAFIPYDMDNSFGIWWSGISPGIDWGTRDPYQWGHPSEPRPLMHRIMAVPEFRERFTLYLGRLVHGSAWSALDTRISALRTYTDPAAEADVKRTLDYGFTIEDYRASFTTALANVNPSTQGHVTYGLAPFINQRRNSLFGQLDTGAIAPVISDVMVTPAEPRPTDPIVVTARIEEQVAPATAQVEYWPGAPDRHVVAMASAPDLGPDFFRGVVPGLDGVGTMDLQVRAVDARGAARTGSLLRIAVGWSRPALYVNEIMALNSGSIVDEFGDADDWIELYNAGAVSISLAGYSLSDDPGEPLQWSLPAVTIAAGGFLLVWADGEPTEGPLHADFRLSGDGESVVLTAPGSLTVDAISFGIQQTGVAWARQVDAGPDWMGTAGPTPGSSNAGAVGVVEPGPIPGDAPFEVTAWPNPFGASVTLALEGSTAAVRFLVHDLLGRQVASLDAPTGRVVWDGRGPAGRLRPGVYFVRAEGTSASPARLVRLP